MTASQLQQLLNLLNGQGQNQQNTTANWRDILLGDRDNGRIANGGLSSDPDVALGQIIRRNIQGTDTPAAGRTADSASGSGWYKTSMDGAAGNSGWLSQLISSF